MSLSAAARFRYTLAAGSTAVVIGAGFVLVGLSQGSAGTPTPTSVDAPLAAAPSPGESTGDLLTDPAATAPGGSAAVSVTPATGAPKSPSPKATVKKTTKAPATKETTAGTSGKKTTAPVTSGSVTEQVLAHINAARVAEGLKALTLDTNLSKAAALHTQLMIDGCGLSHQCSGESGLGERFSAQDVSWRTAGENIGYGSSGSSDSAKVQAANGLTDSMLAEVPPNDGHRKNLLNPDFTRIGLSIVRDSKGITWMTQDFVG
ncbi:CAP domain-containing protein [Actinoplanes sp. NPDC026670]|uniref:CAP domain-containing protein n=1 Tax=Actinoplanes sp. NPDC026670 TaxID=3154700 RepID=UPI0033C464DA